MNVKAEDTPNFNLTEKELGGILRQIYERDFDTTSDIQNELYRHTLRFLNEAVDKNFTLSIEENREFIEQLKYNNAVFSAFKTHRQQNDLAGQLVDESGTPRSFSDFRKAVTPIIGQYNVNWLRTEYLAALRSARTAERFKRYEADKDLYPNLRWLPSRAAEPREVHRQYYYQVRDLHDRWWLTHYPGCLWGCQCDIENTKDAITHNGDNPVPPTGTQVHDTNTSSPGLDQNPAFTGSLFTKTHPYITESHPGAKKAVERFMTEESHYTLIPTDKGVLRIHSGHGKGERMENIRIGSYLANKHGYEIDLLDNPNGVKSADSYNHTLRTEQEYKHSTTATVNAVDRLIREASKQSGDIVLSVDSDISWEQLAAALRSRVRRTESIRAVTVIREGKDIRLTRNDILSEGFKIRPADLK